MSANEGTKFKGLRWWIIALISLATVINYIDRSALGVMWWAEGDCIAKDLGYTTADMAKQKYAIILNVFMVFYAIGQSVTGRVFDKVGTPNWFCTFNFRMVSVNHVPCSGKRCYVFLHLQSDSGCG